jgi:tetratricopeptide (TPR) repeat protein
MRAMIKTLGAGVSTRLICTAILAICVFTVYLPSLKNGFVWDDTSLIEQNPMIRDFENLPEILTSEDTLPHTSTGFYRPVPYMSYMIDYRLWGLNPSGFHLTNVLLHVLTAVLFFHVTLAILKDNLTALVASALFALHPVQIETVNFLSGGRNTLLCATFMLGAMLSHFKGRRALATVLFAFSLFSKEFAIFMPVALLLHIHIIDKEIRLREALRQIAPYLAVAAIYLAARAVVVDGLGPDPLWNELHLRLLLMPKLFMNYARLLVFPYKLSVPYHFSNVFDTASAMSIVGMVALAVVLYSLRRQGPVLFGALWTFIFLLPVIGILPLGHINAAERYIYIASMGFCIIPAYLARGVRRHLLIAVTCVLLASFAAMIITRTPAWRTNESLFTQMILDAPDRSMGYYTSGQFHLGKGEFRKAEELLLQATIKPPVISAPFFTLATLYRSQGRIQEAIDCMEEARALAPNDPKPRVLLAMLYESAGKEDIAARMKEAAEKEFPGVIQWLHTKARSHYRDGIALLKKGRSQEALIRFQYALAYDPDFSDALFEMGYYFASEGKYDTASLYFLRVTELEPERPDARYNLSLAYMLNNMEGKAVEQMALYIKLGGQPTRESIEILGRGQ